LSGFACICGVVCHLIIYLSKNFGLIIFGFILYGLGIGMGYYPILKTTWKYFPNKKGFLTGFILCVFGLCPMVFTSIADAVINPKGESMEDNYYPDDVAKKMKDFALIMAITMGVCGILSQILMFPLDNVINEIQVNENEKVNKQQSYVSNEIYGKEKELDDENKSNEDNELEKSENINEPFMEAFKSWRFHLFNFMSVGTLCKFINNIISFYSFWIFFNEYFSYFWSK
jgi:MFS family permease